jgi:pyruvate dehydrogenase E2 component (dihydrolipoamide acetyltransferase)
MTLFQKLTVFIMKAVIQALQSYPRFNASLDESGENLIIKTFASHSL